MEFIHLIVFGITGLSLSVWLVLIALWGKFWRAEERLSAPTLELGFYPSVGIVIPARNEAQLLPVTLRSLLQQDYPGSFSVILVDDGSTDGTADVAQSVATSLDSHGLQVISAQPLPLGWTGKLWALEQGIRQASSTLAPDYFLLTDADIEHDKANLRQLVTKAQREQLCLVSLMVLLRCESFWEKLLIPAFVFFFQKLYPFAWVNNPQRRTAAAAGGCILIKREVLEQIGGTQRVRQALIDDCALAQAVKSSTSETSICQGIWLGLTTSTRSLRPYLSLETIWTMVARTAYTQLNYSPLLLLGTVVGMSLLYLLPPISLLGGALTGYELIAGIGLLTWLLMAVSYWPTLKLYGLSPLRTLSLPAIALLYILMTLDSALRHWQGQGGAWKGRTYPSHPVTIHKFGEK